jgi:hypothetical protein
MLIAKIVPFQLFKNIFSLQLTNPITFPKYSHGIFCKYQMLARDFTQNNRQKENNNILDMWHLRNCLVKMGGDHL